MSLWLFYIMYLLSFHFLCLECFSIFIMWPNPLLFEDCVIFTKQKLSLHSLKHGFILYLPSISSQWFPYTHSFFYPVASYPLWGCVCLCLCMCSSQNHRHQQMNDYEFCKSHIYYFLYKILVLVFTCLTGVSSELIHIYKALRSPWIWDSVEVNTLLLLSTWGK
jgi:hypothetical protein